MYSIKNRLTLSLTLSLTLLLLAQWLIVNAAIHHLSEQYILTRLQHDADAVINALDVANPPPALEPSRLGPIYQQPYSGHYFQINIGNTSIRSRSLWDQALQTMTLGAGDSRNNQQPGPQQQQLLVLHTSYQKSGTLINLSIAEDLNPVNRQINEFLLQHSLVSLFILIILLAIQFVIIKNALHPLKQIRRELTQLQAGELSRINEQVPQEIQAVVVELNHSLQALQQRIERSRKSAGNLAHALKTPLSLLKQLGEDDSLQQHPALQQQIDRHTRSIQNIIDSELKRARMAGRVVGGKLYRLKDEIQDLVRTLQAMYRDKNIQATIDIDSSTTTTMDREDLHEMLGNILDNAWKWAEQQCRISATQENQQLSLTVADDGPGCDPQAMKDILQRGIRLDESKQGHGLGLSIVKDIVEQYQGTLHIEHSQTLGGLQITISLPL